MACNEVRLAYQIGGLNGLLAEAEVRHCDTAGLLGVIIKVCLCIHVGVVADDLDGVLVGTDSTVCAQTPELAADCAFGSCDDLLAGIEGQICDIVRDTDGEGLLGIVVVDCDDLCRSGVLGTKTITAGEHGNILELWNQQEQP